MFGFFNKRKINELEQKCIELENKLQNDKKFIEVLKGNQRVLVKDFELNLLKYKNMDNYVRIRFKEKFPNSSFTSARERLFHYLYTSSLNEDGEILEMFDEEADEIWHLLLLDNKKYLDMCLEVFGIVINHIPYAKPKFISSVKKIKILKKIISTSRVLNPKKEDYEEKYGISFIDELFPSNSSINNRSTGSTRKNSKKRNSSKSNSSNYNSSDDFLTTVTTTPILSSCGSSSSCGS